MKLYKSIKNRIKALHDTTRQREPQALFCEKPFLYTLMKTSKFPALGQAHPNCREQSVRRQGQEGRQWELVSVGWGDSGLLPRAPESRATSGNSRENYFGPWWWPSPFPKQNPYIDWMSRRNSLQTKTNCNRKRIDLNLRTPRLLKQSMKTTAMPLGWSLIKTFNSKIIRELHADIKIPFIKHLFLYLFKIITFYCFWYGCKWVLLILFLKHLVFPLVLSYRLFSPCKSCDFLLRFHSKPSYIYGLFFSHELTFW